MPGSYFMRVFPGGYAETSKSLRAAHRDDLTKVLHDRIRVAAEPLGKWIVQDGPNGLPARGGLQEALRAGGRASVAMGNDRVAIRIQSRKGGSQLADIDDGSLRHPVFQRATALRHEVPWVDQKVKKGTYTAAYLAGLPDVDRAAEAAMDEIAGML